MIKECYQKNTSLYFFKDLCFWKFHISWRLTSKNLSKIFNLPIFLCRKLVFENFILATGYVENWCHLHCQSNLFIVLKLLLYRCLLLVLVYQVLNLISPVLIHSSIINVLINGIFVIPKIVRFFKILMVHRDKRNIWTAIFKRF